MARVFTKNNKKIMEKVAAREDWVPPDSWKGLGTWMYNFFELDRQNSKVRILRR